MARDLDAREIEEFNQFWFYAGVVSAILMKSTRPEMVKPLAGLISDLAVVYKELKIETQPPTSDKPEGA